jgi:transposase-like protein
MARRKGTTRRYTKAQKLEILKRVKAGETQVAVAASSGVPLATVGYWTRKAKGAGGANGAARPKANRGRPAATRTRASSGSSRSTGIGWALDGDVLVIRIPLRVFARQIAARAPREDLIIRSPANETQPIGGRHSEI